MGGGGRAPPHPPPPPPPPLLFWGGPPPPPIYFRGEPRSPSRSLRQRTDFPGGGHAMDEHQSRLSRREILQGATALGVAATLGPGPAWAQKKTVKLAFIGPLTGGTAPTGPGGGGPFPAAGVVRHRGPGWAGPRRARGR